MFEGEGDKKKKVYPACSIVGQEGYTIMYSHSILCYEKHCLPHDYGELLRKQLPQFNLNMTGISTEPATTLPSPSGTKRGISLTTLKASLSNEENIIGREQEISKLENYISSRKSEFIAIYGR